MPLKMRPNTGKPTSAMYATFMKLRAPYRRRTSNAAAVSRPSHAKPRNVELWAEWLVVSAMTISP